MADHRVIWAIDIEADTPEQAVMQARNIQLRPDSSAVHFYVYERNQETDNRIDLVLDGMPEIDLWEDEDYDTRCTNPGGHEWPCVEEWERCLCIHCGADGDG